jgi:rRNA maturation endonuclease Nob1
MVCHSCKAAFRKQGLNYCPKCGQKMEELVLTRVDTINYEVIL